MRIKFPVDLDAKISILDLRFFDPTFFFAKDFFCPKMFVRKAYYFPLNNCVGVMRLPSWGWLVSSDHLWDHNVDIG